MANFEIKVGEAVPKQLRKESFFGHDPALQGLVPPGGKLPAQLVLTLDTSNPRFDALNIDVGQSIRLIHPFYYSQGDRFAYHHRTDNQIEFVNFSAVGDNSWPSENFPSILPTRTIELLDLEQIPKRLETDCSTISVGNNVPTVQDHSNRECAACSKKNLRLLASVPSRPIPELNTWDNDYVFALFWFCPDCKAINTHNECD